MESCRLFLIFLLLIKRFEQKVFASNIHPRWEKILKTDFEITIPYLTDHEGQFISHDLETITKEKPQDGRRRGRRSTASSRNFPQTLYLHINTSHSQFPLRLQNNDNLLAGRFAVYRRTWSKVEGKLTRTTVIEDAERTRPCFYKGHVADLEGSSVAISVCDGMMGYIHTGTEHYIIEPLPADVMLVNSFLSSSTHPNNSNNITMATTTTPHPAHTSSQQQDTHHQGSSTDNGGGSFPQISAQARHHIIYRHEEGSGTHSKATQRRNEGSGTHSESSSRRHGTGGQASADVPEASHTCGLDPEVEDADPFLYADDIDLHSSQFSGDNLHPQYHQQQQQHQPVRLKRSSVHSSGNHIGSMYRGSAESKNTSQAEGAGGQTEGEERARSVETIVVVDNTMVTTHGQANVTTYVLTLLNMVNKLFHDQTIGTKINISLVALIVLEGEEPGLVLGSEANQALNNFCHWQSQLKGLHHDHAILLTGLDICSYNGQLCDTLGFAPIEGMCKRYRSCTLNEDNGLGTAFTITHEAGHNFGMRHDGDNNYCTEYSGSIMAPKLLGVNGMFKWSACSRKYLDKFLSSQQAWCLENKPDRLSSLQFPNKLPGEMYDADIQCKWQFGGATKLCNYDFATDHCKALWCYTGGLKCETKFLPAAEGTSCGHSRWCRKGMCVQYGDEGPPPVDGEWSDWSPWSTCSRSCGGGVMYRQRSCSRPRPQYGGAPCGGEPRVYRMCNREACVLGPVDMRAEQCAKYNQRAFRGLQYTWVPYTHVYLPEDQCRLYCKASGKQLYFEMNYKVEDGTPCLIESGGVCIDGDCLHFGCDNVVGSHTQTDICGVCGGDNSTCEVMQGEINTQFKQNEYSYLLTLPKSARSISVREARLSPSYFALRLASGRYLLNGAWRISWPSQKLMAGTLFTYSRPYNRPESLTAEGPTTEDVIVEMLALRTSPVVQYKYTVARQPGGKPEESVTQHNYTWGISVSHCSASCATGERVVSAQCLMDHSEAVDESLCDADRKPLTGVETCNAEPCPPRWTAKDWSSCSKTCGGGIQRRRVMCLQTRSANKTVRVKHQKCASQPRPERRRVCNVQECPPEWRKGRWTKCSRTCGEGQKRRQVVCRIRRQKLPEHYCSHATKPATVETCQAGVCYTQVQWTHSNWSQCSVGCGEGLQTRSLLCTGTHTEGGRTEALPQQECSHLPDSKQPLSQKCENRECDGTTNRKWFMSPWSQCSVTCGQGSQIRLIRCMDSMTGKQGSSCDPAQKPPATQSCDAATPCNDTAADCEDSWSMCHLVPKHNLCAHHFYGKQCCKACQHSSPITDPGNVT